MFATLEHRFTMANKQRRETVQSLERGLEILKIFSRSSVPLGITELSRNLGLAKGSVWRFVNTFVEHGFLTQNQETSKYQLGIGIHQLASRVPRDNNLLELSRPVLRWLQDEIEETVHIAVLNEENKMVFLEKLESKKDIRPNVQLGANLPPHCVANGKALLAFRSDTDVKWILQGKLQKYTETTITSLNKLMVVLSQVKEKGYSTNYGEFRTDVSGLAAPICDFTGLSIAAIGVSVPTQRMSARLVEALSSPLMVAAGKISNALGHTEERPPQTKHMGVSKKKINVIPH